MDLDTKIDEFNKVGKTISARLKKLSIETVRDLLLYFPFRYDDFSQVVTISSLKPGMVATICGRVDLIANRRSPRQKKMLTEAMICNDTDSIKAIWFNQPWITKNLSSGDKVYISGKVQGDLFENYFNSASYEKLSADNIHTARLVPIYSLTDGLTQKQIRYLVKSALPIVNEVEDFLPAEIITEQKLLALDRAISQIHFPASGQALSAARKRLAYDEIFLLQVWSQLVKNNFKDKKAYHIKFHKHKTRDFIHNLNFKLTVDQKKATWEILQDLAGDEPMNRLVEGDVGSGKTVVATIAVYNTALNNAQSVLMAPTEILAFQHYQTMNKLLGKEIKIGLLTRSQRCVSDDEGKLSKKKFLNRCRKRDIDLIIGTHTLIQPEVEFKKLALIIIDEQHRFGVEQRQVLKQKDSSFATLSSSPYQGTVPEGRRGLPRTPHFLSLTATPIPRSLALAFYGDLDLSIIRQMPHGRKSIITKVVLPAKRQLAYEFILKQINSGRQVFVVCPLIDPSDKLGVRSVTEEFKKLDQQIFPNLEIGLLHGRLKSEQKEKVIADFTDNKIKILVSTSVIEVGIDMPNATVMMIEGSERFGLAQLHQFRGRVGRGEHQSYCFLFSDSGDLASNQRLQSLVDCSDGFALAQKDLELRGAGQVYGQDQSGFYNFKMADLSDLDFIAEIKKTAIKFVAENDLSDFPLLKEKLSALGLL